MASIQGIYLALFGRPADPAGLAYWTAQSKNGADLSKVIDTMTKLPEATARFSGLTDAALVTNIYLALFDRVPDAAGLAFFTEQLKSGKQTIGSLAINILDGASGNDLLLVQNREKAANVFTASIDTPAEIAAYSGATAAEFGRTFVKTVTTDPNSIPTADKVQASINTGLPGATGGQTPAGGGAPAGGGSTGGGDTGSGNPTPTPTTVTLDKTFGQDFSGPVSSAWTVDRKAPAGFETAVVGGRTVLKETINENQRSATAFENTQGKALNVPTGTKVVSIEVFVPQEWSASNDIRHAGFWGTTVDQTGGVAGYPIIEFYGGGFRFWDSSGQGSWTAVQPLPQGFQFDAWHTLKMEILDGGKFKYTVDNFTVTMANGTSSVEFNNVILQGYNFNFDKVANNPNESYDILWDTLSTGPTVYIDASRDLTGFDNVVSANSNVFIKDGVTLKADASKVSTLNFIGEGTIHLTNASSFDASTKKLAIIIEGNSGNGSFVGGKANDSIDGGGGNDVIKGGAGNDILKGGAGNDIIWGDLPNVTETVVINYGDDTINGGLGTNVIVLGTQAQDIQLGGQDTVEVVRGQQGDDVIFNFNFGPTNRYDDIRAGQTATDVGANAPGADKTFDILKVSGYANLNEFLSNVTVKIGEANSAYTDKVAAALGTAPTINGNILTTSHGDIYTGPATSDRTEFEIVFEFANSGGSVTFANAMGRWEKLALLRQLGQTNALSPSSDGSAENTLLNSLTYANGSTADPTAGLVTLTDAQETALIGILQSQGNFVLA